MIRVSLNGLLLQPGVDYQPLQSIYDPPKIIGTVKQGDRVRVLDEEREVTLTYEVGLIDPPSTARSQCCAVCLKCDLDNKGANGEVWCSKRELHVMPFECCSDFLRDPNAFLKHLD